MTQKQKLEKIKTAIEGAGLDVCGKSEANMKGQGMEKWGNYEICSVVRSRRGTMGKRRWLGVHRRRL